MDRDVYPSLLDEQVLVRVLTKILKFPRVRVRILSKIYLFERVQEGVCTCTRTRF